MLSLYVAEDEQGMTWCHVNKFEERGRKLVGQE